ncbi:MAG: RluA family pseudouridine synthase [Candidatus Babeliaceae bacterium]
MDQLPPEKLIVDFVIQSSDSGVRLDVFLHKNFPTLARNIFKNLITHHRITINSKYTKPSYILKVGDFCTIDFSSLLVDKQKKDTQEIAIPVIYEHEQFVIINKPAGIMVHATATDKYTFTVADWFMRRYPDKATIGSSGRPGIVHRLDKETSGIMIIAKTQEAYDYFVEQFGERKIKKTYIAVVEGVLAQGVGTISFSVTRDLAKPYRMTHLSGAGRPAVTNFCVMKSFPHHSLVSAAPVTGRTHQIRVHMAAIGHPIVGDVIYGKKSDFIARQALHASSVAFTFDNQEFSFTAPIPVDIERLIAHVQTVDGFRY